MDQSGIATLENTPRSETSVDPILVIDSVIEDLAKDVERGMVAPDMREQLWDKLQEAQDNVHKNLARVKELRLSGITGHTDTDQAVAISDDGRAEIRLLTPDRSTYVTDTAVREIMRRLGCIAGNDNVSSLGYSRERDWQPFSESSVSLRVSTGAMRLPGVGTPQPVEGLGVRVVAEATTVSTARQSGFVGFGLNLTLSPELADRVCKNPTIEQTGSLSKMGARPEFKKS